MSAEILRRAAALMRERATAVTYPSPWTISGGTCSIRCNDGRNHVASTYGGVGTEERAAEHIASWHPAVALAVADWLDAQAWDVESFVDGNKGWVTNEWTAANTAALAVAVAYLGGDQ